MAAKHVADQALHILPKVGSVNGLIAGIFPKSALVNIDGFGYSFLRTDLPFLDYRGLYWISFFIENTEVIPFELVCEPNGNGKYVSCRMPELGSVFRHLRLHREIWREDYGPRVKLVLQAADKFLADADEFSDSDFLPEPRCRFAMRSGSGHGLLEKHKKANGFVQFLRSEFRSQAFKTREKNWRGRLSVRVRAATAYLNKLFESYARLMVVRVDLYPKKYDAKMLLQNPDRAIQEASSDPQKLISDVERLLNNRRHNKLFEHCVGYILKIEYARDRGWHAHAVFLYDGHQVQNDSYYSNEIGNYWADVITNGEGAFWACNRAKSLSRYPVVGVGLIDHSDAAKRETLVNVVVSYLAKSDLFVQCKSFSGQKLFRMGQPPKVGAIKRGRPRSAAKPATTHGQDAAPQQPAIRI